jgi:hypothetical protein
VYGPLPLMMAAPEGYNPLNLRRLMASKIRENNCVQDLPDFLFIFKMYYLDVNTRTAHIVCNVICFDLTSKQSWRAVIHACMCRCLMHICIDTSEQRSISQFGSSFFKT